MYQYGDNNWAIAGQHVHARTDRASVADAARPGLGRAWLLGADQRRRQHLPHRRCRTTITTPSATPRSWRARPLADLAEPHRRHRRHCSNTDRNKTFGLESFWAHGPFKIQGEYMTTDTDRYGTARAPRLLGRRRGTSPASGTSRAKRSATRTACRPRPLPNNPAGGMWQVGLRYDTIDLNDGTALAPSSPTSTARVVGALGGEMDSWTVGVNWYWRSNFKFMLNYVMVDSSQVHRPHLGDLRRKPGQQQPPVQPRRGRQPEHPRSAPAVLLVIPTPPRV